MHRDVLYSYVTGIDDDCSLPCARAVQHACALKQYACVLCFAPPILSASVHRSSGQMCCCTCRVHGWRPQPRHPACWESFACVVSASSFVSLVETEPYSSHTEQTRKTHVTAALLEVLSENLQLCRHLRMGWVLWWWWCLLCVSIINTYNKTYAVLERSHVFCNCACDLCVVEGGG